MPGAATELPPQPGTKEHDHRIVCQSRFSAAQANELVELLREANHLQAREVEAIIAALYRARVAVDLLCTGMAGIHKGHVVPLGAPGMIQKKQFHAIFHHPGYEKRGLNLQLSHVHRTDGLFICFTWQ